MKMISKRHIVRAEIGREPGEDWPEFPIGARTEIHGSSVEIEFLTIPEDDGLGFVSMTAYGTLTQIRKAGNQPTGKSRSVTYPHGVAPAEVHPFILELSRLVFAPAAKS